MQGYDVLVLASSDRYVIGVDISEKAVKQAQEVNFRFNIWSFITGNMIFLGNICCFYDGIYVLSNQLV